MHRFTTLLMLCTLAAFAGNASAQILLENICDLETGAAYGLCNAYCEAMDCDSDDHNASQQACDRVGGRFEQMTGRVPPCELECPCSALPDFSGFLTGELEIVSCVEDGLTVWLFEGEPFTEVANAAVGSEINLCAAGPDGFIGPGTIILPLTEEQDAACTALLFGAAAAAGVACEFGTG